MQIKNKLIIVSLMLCLVLTFTSFAFADDVEVKATPSEGDLIITDTKTEVLRVSANDTSGLHSVILTLIGDYNPIVKDYTYQSTQGYTSHSIDIQPDWSWIASCFVFVVVLFCVFRLLGGLFSK